MTKEAKERSFKPVVNVIKNTNDTNEQNTQEITTVAVCAWVCISGHSCHEISNTLAYYLNFINHLSGFKFEQQQQQQQQQKTGIK